MKFNLRFLNRLVFHWHHIYWLRNCSAYTTTNDTKLHVNTEDETRWRWMLCHFKLFAGMHIWSLSDRTRSLLLQFDTYQLSQIFYYSSNLLVISCYRINAWEFENTKNVTGNMKHFAINAIIAHHIILLLTWCPQEEREILSFLFSLAKKNLESVLRLTLSTRGFLLLSVRPVNL